MELNVEIDSSSGFCYGVVRAIDQAEKFLESEKSLYSLGSIVHNNSELDRLQSKGLEIVDYQKMSQLTDKAILFRAHGEPPSSYEFAKNNNLQIIDCTCPVVLKLQTRVKEAYKRMKAIDGQIIIFGKMGHAEVNGLVGQVNSDAIIIQNIEDIDKIDLNKPINIFSQTTKEPDEYSKICKKIGEKIIEINGPIDKFKAYNTICNQVASRHPHLKEFSKKHSVIIFVSGQESSNGKVLFNLCKSVNSRAYKIESDSEIKSEWFNNGDSVGICGATSTPKWLLDVVYNHICSL